MHSRSCDEADIIQTVAVPALWIGEAGFAVSLMLLPNAVSAEDSKKDEIFFGSMLLLFGMLLVVGAAGVF